jgi:K+-transporting ATPase ATPase A chain
MISAWIPLAAYLGILILVGLPLGRFMADVLEGRRHALTGVLGPLERVCLSLAGARTDTEMSWRGYALAVLAFNTVGLIVVYVLERAQHALPLNPQHLGPVPPLLAWNTAVSFATNTNWQSYSGEAVMSPLTQMLALTVQNFVSAATGIATLAAFIRGFARKSSETLGNFWVDVTRSTVHILLPLALLLAVVLVSQGVVQSFSAPHVAPLLEAPATTQVIPVGPVASQVAIKQLGTNGGGYFNANSAHPFENPTPFSNLLEVLAILLIPAALCHTFGRMVGDARQGWAVLLAILLLFVPLVALEVGAEQAGNPRLAALGVDARASLSQSGGNMEGKETRFGITQSALWAAATTAASNGSVNAMHDSFTPLGGLGAMWLMQLGEVVFGGVGSGLYGLLIFAIVAVFIAGLMVGRTPEYLGKKIESFEMKMASLVILIPPLVVLLGTALAVATTSGRASIANPGMHGFSEILYAFSSAGNNNGSAFAGLSADTPFYDIALGVAMFVARYWLIVPVLAIAGSVARKRTVPVGPGTLPTHTPLFVLLLAGVVVVVGALTFIPALALGPIVEHLQMIGAVR